jgi:hypothetical protein
MPAAPPSAPELSSLPESRRTAFEAYSERAALAEREQRRLDGRSAWIANFRAVTFIGALALFGLSLFGKLPPWGHGAGAGFLLLYGVLAWRHAKVIEQEERAKARAALNRRGMDRLLGKWHQFPERGERFLSPGHPYAADLDVFGQGSLFQLIDQSGTRAGEERLAKWLGAPAPVEQLPLRQEAVQELAPLLDFRQALVVESLLVSRDKVDSGRFVAWAEGGPYLRTVRWALPFAWLIPASTLGLFIAYRLDWVQSPLFLLGLLAALGVIAATRKPLGAMYGLLSVGERGFVRFGETFATIERQPLSAPYLKEALGPLAGEKKDRVSERLRRFSFLYSFAEARQSGQLHGLLNLLTLWDLHWLLALERWRARHGAKVRQWFDALAELEALSSLAGYAHDRPEDIYPELLAEGPRLEAEELGHPLLERPVRNSVSFPGPKSALLVTGSNMSGKTTLLRAIGANCVLALAGAPVCARSMRLSRLSILTSMRVQDSLERGVSYFYAEVQRIKAVLDWAHAANGQAMFLLDEILLGTNTRERQIASREVMRLLLETGAVGAVTSHDLSLASLADEPWAKVRNVHFRDQLEAGQMRFDYRMREGVVDTTNALRVLAMAGVPISAAP